MFTVLSFLPTTFIAPSLTALMSETSNQLIVSNNLGRDRVNFGPIEFVRKTQAIRAEPPEILVMGFHHSGTSVVTKLLQLAGVYIGEANDLLMRKNNPLKYNELKLAVDADKRMIANGKLKHPPLGPWWLGYGYRDQRVSSTERRSFEEQVDKILHKMRTQAGQSSGLDSTEQSWALKDPRLCLLGNQYLSKMKNPICVFVFREPVDTALRLMSYNTQTDILSLVQLAELWEESMVQAVTSCLRYATPEDIIYIDYNELTSSPDKVARKLYADLMSRGVKGLQPIDEEELWSLLGKSFSETHVVRKVLSHSIDPAISSFTKLSSPDTMVLSTRAKNIYKALVANQLERFAVMRDSATVSRVPELQESWSVSEQWVQSMQQRYTKEAYATMISSNDIGYLLGAVVNYFSVRRFDPFRRYIVLLTEEVDSAVVMPIFQRYHIETRVVPKLEEPWYKHHDRCKTFNTGQKIRWGRMFSKLNLFSMTQFDKVIYIDADTLVLRPVDSWFELLDKQAFYAERSPSHKGINAGIIALKPSKKTLDELLNYAKTHEPMEFFDNNQVGCTEQELLNRYFNVSREQEWMKLNDTRHADKLGKRFTTPVYRKELRENGARVVHWLTTKCPKPWDVSPLEVDLVSERPKSILKSAMASGKPVSPMELEGIPSRCDPIMYRIWHHYYWSIIPAKDIMPNQKLFGTSTIPKGLASLTLPEIEEVVGTPHKASNQQNSDSKSFLSSILFQP